MAKPVDLCRVLAIELGVEFDTVRQQARVLRDACLMAKETAGRGAGSVSPMDAANLLIAAVASRRVKDSSDTALFFNQKAVILAADIQRCIDGGSPSSMYEFRLPSSGDAFYIAGFTERTVVAVASLLRSGAAEAILATIRMDAAHA